MQSLIGRGTAKEGHGWAKLDKLASLCRNLISKNKKNKKVFTR
jgi:hypothetical protein